MVFQWKPGIRMQSKSSPAPDQLLWQRLLSGQVLAFEELMRKYYPVLFRYGTRFSRDRALIQDAIQDVFLEVWEKRSHVDGVIPPKPYLMASVRRRIHRLTNSPALVLTADTPESNSFDIEFSVEENFIQTEETLKLAQHLSSLLNGLPPRQQEAVYLKFFHEMSRDEISEVMHISPQSVSNLLQTALKWLKINWSKNLALGVLIGIKAYLIDTFLQRL